MRILLRESGQGVFCRMRSAWSCDRGLRRKRRFEVLDEKGLLVVAIILPETKLELVIMGAIL